MVLQVSVLSPLLCIFHGLLPSLCSSQDISDCSRQDLYMGIREDLNDGIWERTVSSHVSQIVVLQVSVLSLLLCIFHGLLPALCVVRRISAIAHDKTSKWEWKEI